MFNLFAWFLFEGILSNLNTSLISHLTRKIRSGCPVGFPQKTSASRFIRNCTKRYPKIFPDKSLMVGLKGTNSKGKYWAQKWLKYSTSCFPLNQNVTGYFSKIYSFKTLTLSLRRKLRICPYSSLIREK